MKKSKTIFIIVFVLLLSVVSIGIVSLYDGVKTSAKTNEQIDEYDKEIMTHYLEAFILNAAQEMNTDYQPYQYQSDNEKENQLLQSEWQNCISYIKGAVYDDTYFGFSIQNTKTGETLTNHQELLNQKNYLYEHVVLDENGKVSYHEGDLNFWFNQSLLYEIFGDDTIWDDDVETMVDVNQIQINMPQNLDVTFVVSRSVNNDYGLISGTYYQTTGFTPFIMIALIICFVISALFILLYPIRIVEKVNPFLTIKEWKAEVLLTIFTGLTATVLTGCVMITGMTLNNQLTQFLDRYQIGQVQLLENSINFGMWAVTLFTFICVCFLIKYIFVYGLWRYLKEKTLLAAIYRYIKNSLLKITDIDLADSLNKVILRYILVNTGVIIVLTALGGFGCFLAIIYGFLAFFYIKKEIGYIYDDYRKLLKLTHELGQGHFDKEIDEDVGIFNSLKEEFRTIKNGFEKAVQEETKSQNMKTELISNVSHDLKTPITCIKNYVYLLKDENLTQEQRNQYIQNLEQYTNRLTSLIEDLFEVSKVNSGNIQFNMMNLNIIALLEQTIAESEEILNSKGLKVVKNYEHDHIQLSLDGDKTYRVFENLLTNVGKYALSNSRVYIDVKETAETVILEFKNISENQMNFTADEIVERFVRGDKSRHETGSGLGLAIAKSFVEAQNGKFDINIDGDLFKIIIVFQK